MAKHVFKNGTFIVNGVDLSSHVRAIDVKRAKDKVDATGLNGNGAKEWLPGLRDEEMVVTLMNDFDPGEVNETLDPLYTDDTIFPILARPFAGAAGAGNPEYSCATSALFEFDPINAQVGALNETQVTFTANGGFERTP